MGDATRPAKLHSVRQTAARADVPMRALPRPPKRAPLHRPRQGLRRVCGLQRRALTQPVLIFSVSSDVLYPPAEQQALHAMIANSELITIVSDAGHDGFLLEQHEIMPAVKRFLDEHARVPSVKGGVSRL